MSDEPKDAYSQDEYHNDPPVRGLNEKPPKKRKGWPKGKPRPRREVKIYAGMGKMSSKPSGEFTGLDAYKCCDACVVDRCVITEAPFCAHPFKSPLQPAFMQRPEIVIRYNRAKAYLAGQSVDPGRL